MADTWEVRSVHDLDPEQLDYAILAIVRDEQQRICDEEASDIISRTVARDEEVYRSMRSSAERRPINEEADRARPLLLAAGGLAMVFGLSIIYGSRKRP